MSQAPRNPFETSPKDLGRPSRSGGNTWLWVLGIIGGIFLMGAVICCGVSFYAWNQASEFMADAMAEQFASDPVFVEKIGTITETEMSVREAIAESGKSENEGAMIILVKGDKGSGKIVYRTNNETGEVTASLIMENGDEFELQVPDDMVEYSDELESLEGTEANVEIKSIEETIQDRVDGPSGEVVESETGSLAE